MVEVLRFLADNPKILSFVFVVGMATAALLEVRNSRKEKM